MRRNSAARVTNPIQLLCVCFAFAAGTIVAAQEPADQSSTEADAKKRELSERILQKTADARDKLIGKQLGKETQQLQQDVVQDLETLLELLKQSPPPPPSQGNPPPNSEPPSNPQNQNPKPQNDSESKSPRKPKSPGTGSGQNREQPQDSEERHGESRESKQKADRKLRLENDIWGHLPPALREELLNTYGERMLPQYEDFVRKFYEALSEPNRTKKR